MTRPLALLTLICLALTTAGCAVNPATGGANLVLMTENKEKEIGREEHEKVLASMPIYEDDALQAYVERVGNDIAAGEPSTRFRLYVHYYR
jgi:predicted Zn-dependent protease